MIVKDLYAYGGSRRLVEALISIGLRELYPPQALAVEAGLLQERDSFVVAAPTASGKTLIAEMATLKVFFETGGKVIYLVPLRALVREKYEEFSRKYVKMCIRVVQSTGDFDNTSPWFQEADLIIATNEKIDSLIRHRASWIKDVSLVVADEIHLLRDSHRGPTLEIVLTRLRWMNPELRVVALSATIPNALEIAGWLGARLIESDWRPVPLREGVYFNKAIVFNDGTVRWITKENEQDVANLALETICEGGQALVFVNTRKGAETVARRSIASIALLLSDEDREFLKKLSDKVLGSSVEPTRLCRKLAECVVHGVAFHHAGINASQRRFVEDAFRLNRIRLVAATTTLAMGLNLPSRRVIVRDWWRYESERGFRPIPVLEVKQMFGRAGRPGLDAYGEAVLVARNRIDERRLFETYISGSPEEITSQLARESSLRSHILSSIAGAFTPLREELLAFLKQTFCAYQRSGERLASIADGILEFLMKEGMVVFQKGALSATRFGRRVSELYIDPLTGVILKGALHQPDKKEVFPLLHLVTHTPDMRVLALRKRDVDEMIGIFSARKDSLFIFDEEKYPSEGLLAELKAASLLLEWIEETPEDRIVGRFGVGPGDLRTLVDLAEWLLYSAGEIARVFELREAKKTLLMLRTRVKYGVREELFPLVGLRGIGRVRGRNLYNAGYRNLNRMMEASIEELAQVPTLGKGIAEDIKKQLQ